MNIQRIDKPTVHRICSNQVVVDLAGCVKELLENSLDAESTAIACRVEIRLKEYGADMIEVQDNGHGIPESQFASIARKHTTSKISSFEDVAGVKSFGFRGEALSSLCALASRVELVTATQHTSPAATKLTFDSHGEVEQQLQVAREKGTTVTVYKIFESLPVRYHEFRRNVKKEYAKTLALIQEYALISLECRISCVLANGNQSRQTVLASQGGKTLRDNLMALFGAKFVQTLLPITVQHQDKVYAHWIADGFVSQPAHGKGRSSTDRQYFFMNGRPCAMPRISRMLNEVFRGYVPSQYPSVILRLHLEPGTYDINVTPDKRTILLHEEAAIVESMKEQVEALYQPYRSTYEMTLPKITSFMTPIARPSAVRVDTDHVDKIAAHSNSTRIAEEDDDGPSLTSPTNHRLKRIRRSSSPPHSSAPAMAPVEIFEVKHSTMVSDDSDPEEDYPEEDIAEDEEKSGCCQLHHEKEVHLVHVDKVHVQVMEVEEAEEDVPEPETNARQSKLIQTCIQLAPVTLDSLRTQFRVWHGNKALRSRRLLSSKLNNLAEEKEEHAVRTLARKIDKTDFAKMKILGQFNLGFILARLDRRRGGMEGGDGDSREYDLFIIDQHASDEKYNFERLQWTTEMQVQRLIHPRRLAWTADQELVAMANRDILKRNGFEVDVDETRPATERIRLHTLPVLKGCQFSDSDLEELLFLLGDRPGEMVRCSKVRSVFASKACRTSYMIGDALSYSQMRQIVKHMGELDQPWNCPHGRPTMRWIYRGMF